MNTSLASLLLAQAAVAQAAAPSPCAGEVHDAFDFWVGDWDVFRNGQEVQVARSRIERLHGGCAIREHWMPLRGAGGSSLSGFDPATGRWHQSWIGSAPGVVRFEGGPVDGRMVLTGWWPGSGPNGANGLTRMTYSVVEGGAVRQFGEFSADHGLTWQPSFDFLYRKRDATGD